jgi:hypothetical protein
VDEEELALVDSLPRGIDQDLGSLGDSASGGVARLRLRVDSPIKLFLSTGHGQPWKARLSLWNVGQ